MQSESEVLAAVAERVRGLRAERGWTQEMLAEKAHVDRSYLAGIEMGSRNPSIRTLINISNALGVSVAELLGK